MLRLGRIKVQSSWLSHLRIILQYALYSHVTKNMYAGRANTSNDALRPPWHWSVDKRCTSRTCVTSRRSSQWTYHIQRVNPNFNNQLEQNYCPFLVVFSTHRDKFIQTLSSTQYIRMSPSVLSKPYRTKENLTRCTTYRFSTLLASWTQGASIWKAITWRSSYHARFQSPTDKVGITIAIHLHPK